MNAVSPAIATALADLNPEDVVVAVIIVVRGEIAAADLLIPDNPNKIQKTSTPVSGTSVNLCDVTKVNGGKWRVAIAYQSLPGNNHAARLVTELKYCLPNLGYVIMCGIAGAVPHEQGEFDTGVRPGDLIVSDRKGVLQYDFGEETVDEISGHESFQISADIIKPSTSLQSIVSQFRAHDGNWRVWLDKKLSEPEFNKFKRPLKAPKYVRERAKQQPQTAVDISKEVSLVGRLMRLVSPKPVDQPKSKKPQKSASEFREYPWGTLRTSELKPSCRQVRIAGGVIGSANRVLRNPRKRDALFRSHGIMAVDMESAGIADAAAALKMEYLIVRGVADFCDESKAAEWQHYAAAVAAAFTRAVISEIRLDPSTSKIAKGAAGEEQLVPEEASPELARAGAALPPRAETVGTADVCNADDIAAAARGATTTRPMLLTIAETMKEIRRLDSVHDFRASYTLAMRLLTDIEAGAESIDNEMKADALQLVAQSVLIMAKNTTGEEGMSLKREALSLVQQARHLNGQG